MTSPRSLLVLSGVTFLAACGDPPGGTGADGGTDAGVQQMQSYTWYRDVLPIVQERCQGCHAAGGVAPFALEKFETAQPLSASIANAVETRRMPPWTPDPSCNTYLDERRLTDAEIAVITGWHQQGAHPGDPNDAPAPRGPAASLPWVDAELSSGIDYTPSNATGPDDYHCFMLDPALTTARDVIGFDIVPGVRSQVHHVLLYSADKANAESVDGQSPEVPGWTCFGGPGTTNPSVVGGWVPGTPVTQYPAGTGIRLAAGKVLVMQIHYNTSNGAPAPDRTVAKLQYSKQPVQKPAQIVSQVESTFAIPANSTGYTTSTTSPQLPFSATAYGVLPHMHTLGRKIKVTLSPSNTCVVDIPKWDFHWQQFYMLKTPIQIPAGSTSVLSCTWDNPTSNIVRWGEGTSDEMCLNYAYVTVP